METHPNGRPLQSLKPPKRNDTAIFESVFPTNYLGDILRGLMVTFLSKQEHRTGWGRKSACSDTILQLYPNETVAAHQWGVSTIILTLARHPKFQEELPEFNHLDAIEMALVHDVAEVITGDITPVDGVSPEDKHQRESDAMEIILGCFPEELKQSLHSIYAAYEDRISDESKFVKDCDRLDFIIQAFILERQGFGGFSEFYTNSIQNGFSTKIAADLASTLIETRERLINEGLMYKE